MGKFYEGLAEALIPYVAALGWWHAVPDDPPNKNPKVQRAVTQKLSRREMLANPDDIELPWVQPELLHLVAMLFEAGPISAAGMGPITLTWADIESWQRCVGFDAQPWHVRLLRRLSSEYLTALKAGEAFDAPRPWESETTEERRVKIAQHVKNLFQS